MSDTTMRKIRGAWLAAILAGLALAAPVAAQSVFPSPDAAVDALVDSLATHDWAKTKVVLGPEYRRLAPEGGNNAEDVTNFLAAWSQGHKVVTTGTGRAVLELANGWQLPVPIVKGATGWSFDTKGAADEMRTRRIGRNELAAIQSMYAYVDAQREYAEADRNGDGVLEYAQKIISSPGRKDGLYWPTVAGEARSPAGPLLDTEKLAEGYHGYRFRILKAQGKAAPGGARDYVRDGRMTRGYALIAWPAKYGETGVMSFIVNHDGVAYQKNLGPDSAAVAKAMTRFDPDASWKALPPPQ